MRLLQYNHGIFSLTPELLYENIPEYAILSHTWGKDTEEVNFNDILDGTGKVKAGYEKLRFCAKRASLDKLQYFWIDTCCIDKRSTTVFGEAINSMYQWYSKATKCYAYLTDVRMCTATQDDPISELPWESAFRKSRWFTRGWTLVELLAPSTVEFYSAEGQLLGNKKSLKRQIHEMTGIDVKALEGESLSNFSIKERMGWAEHRNTTRIEDKAYCLLGIFGVNMLPNYGEGEHAFVRLHNKIIKHSRKQLSSFRQRQLASTGSLINVSADDFIAVHENGVENPGPDFPLMKYWYREQVGASGYPDSVVVEPKFQDPDVRPPGETILSLRAISNVQLRGEASNILPGCYRVQWIVWLWAGKNYPVGGAGEGYPLNSASSTPVAHFTENSVVERIFPCKSPHDTLRRPDKPFWFPWGMRFSVGKARHPGARFSYCNDIFDERPIAASELLQPGFEESVLSGGLWHTLKNSGWCEIGGGVVDVDEDGRLAFVAALWEVAEGENGSKFIKIFGGFSFAGVRLELVT